MAKMDHIERDEERTRRDAWLIGRPDTVTDRSILHTIEADGEHVIAIDETRRTYPPGPQPWIEVTHIRLGKGEYYEEALRNALDQTPDFDAIRAGEKSDVL